MPGGKTSAGPNTWGAVRGAPGRGYTSAMARAARRTGNLPAETSSFIGRRRELAEIRKKLAASRLVTLTGPGGVGKTRLAVRAAAAAARGFRDGVILVELAEARDGGAVAGAAVAALDLRDQAPAGPLPLLLSYLQDKELLLVLDNCEHLLDAAARLVAGVLRAAPGVRVIATSREPLLAPGEHVVPVLPLEVPPADPAGPLARLRQNESVMLFAERAAAASGGFELTEANRDAVAELCRRLDGLPLAVELAAARTRVLPAEQILGLLADRFGLLTGGSRAALPRHQALLAAIDWSHDLLRDAERTVLRRCCAFAGRFTLDDAEAVCASAEVPAAQALGVLSSLVDKSLLVRQDAQGRACYRMHETMREFAVLKLAEAGEADAVELRCARYYQAACRRPAPERRHRLGEWLQWADLEADNLRGVLRQCLNRGDTALGLDLAVSLGWFWITRAATEGMRWLGEFAAAAGEGGDPQVRAWAWFLHGFLAVLKAGPQAAGPSLEAAVAAARQAGQPGVLAEALAMASVARSLAGDSAAAGRLAGEAHAAASGLDYPPGGLAVAQARVFAGFAAGDLARAASWAAEGAGLARETGDLYGLEMMLLNQGTAALLPEQDAGGAASLTGSTTGWRSSTCSPRPAAARRCPAAAGRGPAARGIGDGAGPGRREPGAVPRRGARPSRRRPRPSWAHRGSPPDSSR